MTLPGGPADKLGNRYEKFWTVYQLLCLLDGRMDAIRIEDPGVEKAEFVIHRGPVAEFHQAKRVGPRGNWSIASLGAVGVGVLQAMNTLLADENARFVFVSGGAVSELGDLCDAATSAESEGEFISKFLAAKGRRQAFERVCRTWACDVATAIGLLRRIEVRTTGERDLEEKVRFAARALFLADSGSVLAELMVLAENSVHRSIRRDDLVEGMRARGFAMRHVAGREQAVMATRQATDSFLQAARRKLIHGELLSRRASEKLRKRIGASASVIVGKAGSGKTACTVEVVDRLRGSGVQVLAFRLDRHVSASDTADLGRRLGLEESPLLILAAAAEATGTDGVLIVDQLDAVSTMSGRSSDALDVVEDLLGEAEAMRARVQIHVVVVCRSFDCKNDHRLRQLIRDSDAEVLVDELTDDETRGLLSKGGFQPSLFRETQLRLLRNPQNLSLFLDGGFDRESAPTFDTVIELFDRYWDEKRSLVVERAGRSIQKSGVFSTGIGTAGIQRSGSTRRGVRATPRHAADGRMMSGECCGGVLVRAFPPDGCARALGCRGAAERRTASLGEWAAQGCPAARMASRASCGRAA